MKVLHVMPYEKWAYQLIKTNREILPEIEHVYYLYSLNPEMESKIIQVKEAKNVYFATGNMNLNDYIILEKNIQKADAVVFHSLFLNQKFLTIVNLFGILYKRKFRWFIWGGDLYNLFWVAQKSKAPSILFNEIQRKFFIKYVPVISACCKQDLTFLRSNYKTSATFQQAFYMHPMIAKFENVERNDSYINVLIGNNGDSTCRHIESMKMIAPYFKGNMKIYVILSYGGNEKYKNKVIETGIRLFGKKLFIPIINFQPYDKYVSFLNSIDVAIMNHNRQQAGSNIIMLLRLGCKVYINPENSFYDETVSFGCVVYKTDEIDEGVFVPLTEDEKNNNYHCIEEMQSNSRYKKLWLELFIGERHDSI